MWDDGLYTTIQLDSLGSQKIQIQERPTIKHSSKSDTMSDELDALLAEIDGVELSKFSPKTKAAMSESANCNTFPEENINSNTNHKEETENRKLDHPHRLTLEMEQLMSHIEDFGAHSCQDEEDDRELFADESKFLEEKELYVGFAEISSDLDCGEMPMEKQFDSRHDPPEFVMINDDSKQSEPKEESAAATSAGVKIPELTKESVERNLCIMVAKGDSDELMFPKEQEEEYDESLTNPKEEEDPELLQLFEAAQSGAWHEIQQLCNADPNFPLDIQNEEGFTAVSIAAFYGHTLTVETFLKNGADPNIGDIDHCTPLHCAAQEGFADVVRTLIRYKADVNMPMKTSGRTPLFLASQEGDVKIVKILLEAKAWTAIDMNGCGCTPLFISVQESHHKITKLLLENKADPDKASSTGTPPLLMAVQKEDLLGIRILLESGANVNKATPSGVTALSKAMFLEYTSIVRLLKSYGAIMNSTHGETLQEVAERVMSNLAPVHWKDTARTAADNRRKYKSSSGYGMLTRTI